MNDFVAAEGGRLSESFSADFANKGTGTGVHGHVTGEIVVRVEDLAAFGTCESFLLVTAAAARAG